MRRRVSTSVRAAPRRRSRRSQGLAEDFQARVKAQRSTPLAVQDLAAERDTLATAGRQQQRDRAAGRQVLTGARCCRRLQSDNRLGSSVGAGIGEPGLR